MSEFQMVMLCIIGIAMVSITHSIYLMLQINKRDKDIKQLETFYRLASKEGDGLLSKLKSRNALIGVIEQKIEELHNHTMQICGAGCFCDDTYYSIKNKIQKVIDPWHKRSNKIKSK